MFIIVALVVLGLWGLWDIVAGLILLLQGIVLFLWGVLRGTGP